MNVSSQLAHELRTPLAVIIGSIDATIDRWSMLEKAEIIELLSDARAEASHLLAVVERAAGRESARGPVTLADVARQALGRFPAVEARTYLRMDRRVVAWSDQDRVDQILTNLFQNVSRYAPTGDVEIELEDLGDTVTLVCHDSGPGIPLAHAERIFHDGAAPSDQGMHVGLALSRRLARELDGDLCLVADPRPGAAFRLTLPAARAVEASIGAVGRARIPRGRVMTELAEALSERSASRVEIGLQRLAIDLLGASSAHVLVRRADRYESVSNRIDGVTADVAVLGELNGVAHITDDPPAWWNDLTKTDHGALVRLASGSIDGVLAIGMPATMDAPLDPSLLSAIAVVGGLAVERSLLSEELANERLLRATVMQALPIAVSIFAGDPPVVIDQNQAELELLGIAASNDRPVDLAASQSRFEVRFADGTPLSVENAPVTQAIRQGERAGPFYLRVRRADGSEVVTRTYCAPFGGQGLSGAVVTSEPVADVDR